ncbi:MAG: response regulator [Bacteroidetes bacterium]|nr:response regulator [Rhodothermia bacterium]MCS7155367.1 response regulator [Bacteroidota bacterium]MCX7907540.1 response regulator [Bacteroidota bacterium]MDW8138534.1 response regulator [Bacteroidota bacterium]MDW8284529.1 response regulator [Bacteroidota bacterium]
MLVVEDNPDVRRLLVLYLRGRYEVVEAATGEEAFRIVQERPVDAILMDINLPGDWSGLDAARAIRALPGMAHVPIIAQTAYAALFDEQQVLAAGCSYYMNKPIYRHELLSVLERFLSHP